MRARLTIVRGEATPAVCDLDPERPLNLGRSRENDIVLHDEHASRQHAQIYQDNGRWFLRDCGTRNGTRINAARIQDETLLRSGLEFDIADMRLRFVLLDAEGRPLPPPEPAPDSSPDSSASGLTTVHVDELPALHEFMTQAINKTDANEVVRLLLDTVSRQSRATVTGYLSLDEEGPRTKMVLPERAHVDFALSQQLTRRVQKEGQAVWLKAGLADFEQSDSLLPFQDAVCVPLKAEGTPLGALHAYKSGRFFSDREVRFCEVAAGYAAASLARLRQCRRLLAENSRLRGQTADSEEIIGDSPAMQRLHQWIAKAAPSHSTVLIHGETGAGKELVALALHRLSPRAGAPLVVANCGAIAPTLLESELFGHCKGSFSGATAYHKGLFEQADEGTLFLDEVGDMPLECQVKLLRVLEGKAFRPVGGTSEHEVRPDVRLVAASHKDLEKEVRANRFRHDLYFRLRVLFVEMPALREHCEDVPALAEHFLAKFAAETGKRKTLSPAAVERLTEYSWPGNVRELRTVIERAVVMSEGDVIDADELLLDGSPSLRGDQPLSLKLEHVEAWAVQQAMEKTKGNVLRAAKILDISRETLAMKLKKYGIARAEWLKGANGVHPEANGE